MKEQRNHLYKKKNDFCGFEDTAVTTLGVGANCK
jgi:hypothetical protein